MLRDALADGIVTSRAWNVRIALKDGTNIQAHLARVPEDIVSGLSAFFAVLPDSSEPVAVIAEDESGSPLGAQGLSTPR
jgi:hypothetical protein